MLAFPLGVVASGDGCCEVGLACFSTSVGDIGKEIGCNSSFYHEWCSNDDEPCGECKGDGEGGVSSSMLESHSDSAKDAEKWSKSGST